MSPSTFFIVRFGFFPPYTTFRLSLHIRSNSFAPSLVGHFWLVFGKLENTCASVAIRVVCVCATVLLFLYTTIGPYPKTKLDTKKQDTKKRMPTLLVLLFSGSRFLIHANVHASTYTMHIFVSHSPPCPLQLFFSLFFSFCTQNQQHRLSPLLRPHHTQNHGGILSSLLLPHHHPIISPTGRPRRRLHPRKRPLEVREPRAETRRRRGV